MNQHAILNLTRLLICGVLLALIAGRAQATLGQAPTLLVASSSAKPQILGAKKIAFAPVASSDLFTLHESQLETGTAVREFTTPTGVVFAVSWLGPVLPDLSDLLGSYFATFKGTLDQARAIGQRGAPVNIQQSDLVVKSNGRMRHFFGYAYAPTLVPSGVNINDILQ